MLLDTDLIFYQDLSKDLSEHFNNLAEQILANDWTKPSLSRPPPLACSAVIFHRRFYASEQGIDKKDYDEQDTKIENDSYIFIDYVLQKFSNHTVLKSELSICFPHTYQDFHIDPRVFHRLSRRLHIPIITNDRCVLEVEYRKYHLQRYGLYEFNNILMHRSFNAGNTLRGHLIIDIIDNDVLEKFTQDNPIHKIFEKV